MTRPRVRRTTMAVVMAIVTAGVEVFAVTLQPQTLRAWNAYVEATEARIAHELGASGVFLGMDFTPDSAITRASVVQGTMPIEKLKARDRLGRALTIPAGLVQHWRGSVLVPGTALGALLNRLQHPEDAPLQQDVLSLKVRSRRANRLELGIRMTYRRIVTVTYDTVHAVEYEHHGPFRASSRSVGSHIVEIDDAGTPAERPAPGGEDRGFLWRMNSYWRYEQVAEGVVVELESLTLSRAVPLGLGLIVEPIVDRLAREAMDRTLEHLRRTYARRGA
ncbi:MAG: hypothetical protein ACT4QD_09635 [Acidobacteriota bacterium]